MKEAFKIDIQSQFDSLNGGISMWLPRLADYLVEHGASECLQRMQKDSASTQEQRLQGDFSSLINGVSSIDITELENAIAPLRDPYQRMRDISSSYQQCVESLEQAEQRWQSAAKSAKYQLEAWGKWAYETEVILRKKSYPWSCAISNIDLSFKFCGGKSVLDSPQTLRANQELFNRRVSAITELIKSRSYIAEALPQNLNSPDDFYSAIASLEEYQEQANDFCDKLNRTSDELNSVEASYYSKKGPLINLLWQMPQTAHWALFRTCRPDLFKLAEA